MCFLNRNRGREIAYRSRRPTETTLCASAADHDAPIPCRDVREIRLAQQSYPRARIVKQRNANSAYMDAMAAQATE
jgi:hypothetical protein